MGEQHLSDFRPLDGKVYPPFGSCIYCGASDSLTKEHILPFGLSGTAILPQSSCRCCARITGAFEQALLRGSFWPVRVFRDLKSRTKHADAPSSYPMKVIRHGKEEMLELGLSDLPILLHFPHFVLPRHWTQVDRAGAVQLKGIATVLFGKRPEAIARELGVEEFRFEEVHKPIEFARMVAKIGYAFACAEGAINDLEGPAFVVPAILGKRDDIGDWVGTLEKPFASHPGILHRIELPKKHGFLWAEVQLFADSETPSYVVMLGKLKI